MRSIFATAAFLLSASAAGKTLLGPRGVPWDENDASLLVQPRQRPSPGASASEAYHYRFSYSDTPQTEAYFSWTSLDGESPAEVQLGTEAGKYVHLYSAETVTYAAADLCSSGSGYKDPGYFHHAKLTDLSPNTRYWVVPMQNKVLGAETTFRTGKARGGDVATRFAVYGDQYSTNGEGATSTAAHLTERINTVDDIDYLLHVGDLSYGCGDTDRWNAWHDIIEPYSGRISYLVNIGNHEYDYTTKEDGSKDPSGVSKTWHPAWSNAGSDGGGECGVPTARRFRYPLNGNGVFWYSFDAGNVHVVMASSEHDVSPGSPQGLWLEKDLMGVDRALSPWVILGLHRPMVETQEGNERLYGEGLRKLLEPLLLRARVDVVFSGHYHSFQRTCPMANLACVPYGGITHYTTGAAGHPFSMEKVIPTDYMESSILHEWGYSIFDAPNATAMHLGFYCNHNNTLCDSKWIYHTPPPPPAASPPPPPPSSPSPPPSPPSLQGALPWQCFTASAVVCLEPSTFEPGIWRDASPAVNDLLISGAASMSPLTPGVASGVFLSGDAWAARPEYAPQLGAGGAGFSLLAWVWCAAEDCDNTPLFTVGRSPDAFNNELVWKASSMFEYCTAHGEFDYFADASPAASGWQHVALSHQGLSANFYLNGVPVGGATAHDAVTYAGTSLTVGGDTRNHQYLTGYLGQLAAFNSALSANEVANIFHAQQAMFGAAAQ